MVVNQMDQWGPIFRSEIGYYDNNSLMEKRQLFLRSYQFCRKKSVAERIKRSFVRVKGVIWFRLRSVRKFRKLVWTRFRFGFSYRRRRFVRLLNNYYYINNGGTAGAGGHHRSNSSNCFW